MNSKIFLWIDQNVWSLFIGMFQNSLRFFSSLIALYQSITSDIFWYIFSCYFCSISSDFFFRRWSTLSPLLLFPFNCFHPFILSLVAQMVKNLPAVWVDLGSIPGLGRSPREGKGYPLQYSGLENPMDYSPWGLKRVGHDWATFTFTHSLYLKWASCTQHIVGFF